MAFQAENHQLRCDKQFLKGRCESLKFEVEELKKKNKELESRLESLPEYWLSHWQQAEDRHCARKWELNRTRGMINHLRRDALNALDEAKNNWVKYLQCKEVKPEDYQFLLEKENGILQEEIRTLKTQLKEKDDETTSLKKSQNCLLCLTEAIQYTLVPCGHVFCMQCTHTIQSTCPICEFQLESKVLQAGRIDILHLDLSEVKL